MPDAAAIASLVAYWRDRQGGAERANYQLFLTQLGRALGVPEPGAASGGMLGDYQFEGPVPGGSLNGGTGYIDLYKRGCFILEAKQSRMARPAQEDLALFDPAPGAPAAPSGTRYDQLMRDARRQAEQYAHSLPGSHAPVPFLIVCDVGRAFELYFDYAGNGRGYGFFPDKQRYRIALADLAGDATIPGIDRTAADTLRAIWTDPAAIDPRVRAADVTRDVARKLAQVSVHLEEEGRRELKRRGEADAAHEAELIEGTALFLMRILFCMFAEDVGLLPKDRFTEFLQSCVRPYDPDRPGDLIDEATLRNGLVSLWTAMDAPDPAARYAFALREQVRWFNGGLFGRRDYYRLYRNDLDSLIDAARHRWTNVEPAIFGTLLEQALSPADRAKLGAHYTPRPYVERLVQATITDVLAPEWAAAEARIGAAREAGDDAGALAEATGFLAYLQRQRVLDPACGTGNFLYVAMETLLRLESDVIETIASLGGRAAPAIGPANFLGLELNPRAAVIAELVLWIGWLRWRTANDPAAVPDPVLERTGSINFGSAHGYDAVLAGYYGGFSYNSEQRAASSEQRAASSEQRAASSEQRAASSEQRAASSWPPAEFIVGNPPFIGKGSSMRKALGDDYVEALWKAHPNVPRSADFVMFWWDRAADELIRQGTVLRRFGFVTTNSITQEFNRRVIQRHLASSPSLLGEGDRGGAADGVEGPDAQRPSSTAARAPAPPPSAGADGPPTRDKLGEDKLSLVFAIPDHPWTKASRDAAAVRIAMTVAEAGAREGALVSITEESNLNTDAPTLEVDLVIGPILDDLTIGARASETLSLRANTGMSCNGMMLAGQGFRINEAERTGLLRSDGPSTKEVLRPHIAGSELLGHLSGDYVIDFFGLTEREARQRFPGTYSHVLASVKPERDHNRRLALRTRWWIFAEPRSTFRPALQNINRYIATTRTSKHRVFQFVDVGTLPNHEIVAIASDSPYILGVLSSGVHSQWARMAGGTLRIARVITKVEPSTPSPSPSPTPPPTNAP